MEENAINFDERGKYQRKERISEMKGHHILVWMRTAEMLIKINMQNTAKENV